MDNKNDLTGASGVDPAEPIPASLLKTVNLAVDGSSTWDMTASSTVNNLTVNGDPPQINFPKPSSDNFHTLVVNNLIGSGGNFGMFVDLPNLRGDLLVVQTPAPVANTHHLEITNINQGQDLPVNSALLVVQTAQTSGLEFPSNEVDAGTFKRVTERGDSDNPGGATDPHNWYLVREDEPEPTPTPSPSP